MNNVLNNKNNKLIGILFIVSGISYIAFEIDWLIYSIRHLDEDLLYGISELMPLVSIILFAVAFFLKNKILFSTSCLLIATMNIILIVRDIIYLGEMKEYGYSIEEIEEHTQYIMMTYTVSEAIIAVVSIYLAAGVLTKYGLKIPTKIAVIIFSALQLYDIIILSMNLHFYGIVEIIFNYLYCISLVAALVIAYFIPKQIIKTEQSAFGDSLQKQLEAVKAQYENKQISEEEYSQKKAEILAKL